MARPWELSVDGCVGASPDGFTVIRANEAGRATLEPDFSLGAVIAEPALDC